MTFLLDVRHTARSLRRAPAFVAIAVLSIAIGVGANTLVFSWMDNLVLHPFPALRAPGRLVGIETAFPTGDGGPVSYPAFLEWREGSRSFSGMAAWSLSRVSARRAGENGSTSLIAMLTTGNYFDVLGGLPQLGRSLTNEDERARAPVAVLGYEAWRREFGADTATIGRAVHLNGAPFTIVGVAAPKFVGTYLGVVPDMFVPVTLQPLLTGVKQLEDRRARAFQVVARLDDAVTPGAAQSELDAFARRLSESYGERPVLGAEVTDARMRYLGGLVSPLFSATLVVTGILLLVACANVAGLLLVRATARSAEMSLRLAVGAARSDLWRLALLESGAVALAGSGLGVLLAYVGRGVVSSFIPTTTFPMTLPIEINARVLGFAIGVAIVTSVLCALIPAMRSSRSSPGAVLKGATQTLVPSASRLRLGIVASQLAFSLVCLITAGLFVRSLKRAGDLDLGFPTPARVLLVNTDLAPAQVPDSSRTVVLREMLRRVRALPGVEYASAATFVPLGFGGRRVSTVRVDGYATLPDEDMSVIVIRAADDYAATMGITVVTGRDISARDRAGAEPIALVNETFARRWLGTTSPVGRRVDLGRGWATIGGVLRDGKYATVTELAQPVVYVPIEQDMVSAFTLHVRTTGNARLLAEGVRGALRVTHMDLPALQPRTLSEHIAASTFVSRVGASVLSAFGAIALVLALVGLYAAIAFSVALRGRELGIRRALGADGTHVVAVVLRPALRVLAVGAVVGVVLSYLLGQVLRARVPQLGAVVALEPLVFVAGSVVLLIAGALSAWLPARRALRIHPAAALRDSSA